VKGSRKPLKHPLG